MKLTDAAVGMNIIDNADFECEICVEGKMTQHRNREPDRRADSILQLVHCDIAGPIDPITKDGFQYVLGFIDDYSSLLMVYFLKQKSDNVRATERFLAEISPYGSVKCIRSDQGTEFTSNAFESLLVKHSLNMKCLRHIHHTKPVLLKEHGVQFLVWQGVCC